MLDIFDEIARMRREGERGALATVISTRGSTPGKETMRLLVRSSGSFVGTVGGGCVEAEVVDAALEVLADETPRRVTFRLTESATGSSGLMCGGEIEVFIEPITAPPLVVFGAGHISQDLCEVASRAGFRVTVLDDRESFAHASRFPRAQSVIARETFEACFAELRIPPSAYCVVVTRGHAMDLECTDFALHSPAPYVGLIGSQVKVKHVLARLRDAGRLEGVDLERLHAPIGLDIGAKSHGEIAVAIVAELVAHRHAVLPGLATKRIPAETMRKTAARPSREEGAPPRPEPAVGPQRVDGGG
jgi:xanthine dehydrogenase accessory factor